MGTRRLLLRLAAIAFVPFLAIQMIRPELTVSRPAVDLPIPVAVKQILIASCYPCHSNQTRLSWFDQIVPVYQLAANDVKKARAHLNFSELGGQPLAQRNAVLFECLNQIQMGAMPLPRYARVHPDAVVSPTQLAILRNYLLTVTPEALSAESTSEAADSQYRQWIASARKPLRVENAPNGIAFMPDYKNWKAISGTDRIDTKTLRMILGNEVAVQAIAHNNINPWPDGTILAKVAWRRKPGANGASETGEFFRMALMIKDRVKYTSTAGWGWAQWVGTELKPYGGPGFEKECVGCHAPLSKNDYVFTMPIPSGSPR